MVVNLQSFWSGKRVLITGHTGFKGSWLSLWLKQLGTETRGYALAPQTPSLFECADLATEIVDIRGDVNDFSHLQASIQTWQPEIVFHLAAQSLVREGYRQPIDTYRTNVMGTINLLEALRHCPSVRVCQIITSDKCYAPSSQHRRHTETDPLGGEDPYSSSKACAELVTHAYKTSYFSETNAASIATCRAGNVIGGGDWAHERLIPDCIRALSEHKPIQLRHPHAIRPWQFVLEPLYGYLLLAMQQWEHPQSHASAWNFGPLLDHDLTVGNLAEKIIALWGSGQIESQKLETSLPENPTLRLDSTKTRKELNWQTRLSPDEGLRWTIQWYREAQFLKNARAIKKHCLDQIKQYEKLIA